MQYMLWNFITCLVIFLAVKRYIVTPTPTRFTIFVKLMLIASIKPHYNTPNNSKWLSQLTVSGAKKNRTMRKVLTESGSSPHIFTMSQHMYVCVCIYIYIYIYMKFLARLTCRTDSNSHFWYTKNSYQ